MKPVYFLLYINLLILAAGCKKYEESPLVSNPAYMRVFNNLPSGTGAIHSGRVAPFLTFLMDPVTNASGIPVSAEVTGDFLGPRQLFSLSYPINSANNGMSGTVGGPGGGTLYPVNYEYPGNEHVLTAPAINGFDLSAWAQAPSGKHRIMFVTRPQNNTPFRQLSEVIRSNVLLDTTLEFLPGEVYTLEVISRDLDNSQYGLYVRREQFIHQAFEPDKMYVGFVNLSGKTPVSADYGFGSVYPARAGVYCTYKVAMNHSRDQMEPLPGYNNAYFATIGGRMDTNIVYQSLPLLPRKDFFEQDTLRPYMPDGMIMNGYGGTGTLPQCIFSFMDIERPGRPGMITCTANPRTFNNFNPEATFARLYAPNLNLIVNSNNAYHIYPALNILEIVYDRVYLMQIQKGFNEVP